MSKETDRARAAYRKWYETNREVHNAKRRQRYSEDEKYRRRQRGIRRGPKAKTGPKSSKPLLRLIGGSMVEVWRIGQVANKVGRSAQVIRGWEKNGYLPGTASFEGGHRFYTKRQVELIKRLAKTANEFRYATPARLADEMAMVAHTVIEDWEVSHAD